MSAPPVSLRIRSPCASPRPDLGDITVNRRQIEQPGFRTDDPPLGIVNQAVSGYKKTQRSIIPDQRIFLQRRTDAVQTTRVQISLQLGRSVLRVLRSVGRLPRLVIVIAPFAFERLRVSALHPEFRFLQVNGLHPGIHRRTNPLDKKICITDGWYHIRNIYRGSMDDRLAILILLGFVPMGAPVNLAVQIVLVTAPGHSGHEMHMVAPLRPFANALGHRFPNAIHHHKIRLQIVGRMISTAFLKSGPFFRPCSSRHS